MFFKVFTYSDTLEPININKKIFTVQGETKILEKLKINVLYLNHDSSENIYTVFRNNQTFKSNLGRIYYTFYINYDNNQYGTFGLDSLRHAFGIDSDIISVNFFENDGAIYYCYQRFSDKRENCKEDKELLNTLTEVNNHYMVFSPFVIGKD
jgi:hypothetical protein